VKSVVLSAFVPLILMTLSALAQPAPTPARDAAEVAPAPVLSQDAGWVRGVLIGVGALAGLAVLIGPVYRANLPEELPPTHSHDEPPGASRRHGPEGEYEGRRMKAEG
jgi:hypothetical protein